MTVLELTKKLLDYPSDAVVYGVDTKCTEHEIKTVKIERMPKSNPDADHVTHVVYLTDHVILS